MTWSDVNLITLILGLVFVAIAFGIKKTALLDQLTFFRQLSQENATGFRDHFASGIGLGGMLIAQAGVVEGLTNGSVYVPYITAIGFSLMILQTGYAYITHVRGGA